jgi:hypothetical protein
MAWRFEDYKARIGYTRVGHVPYATLAEFYALVGTGSTHEVALTHLKEKYEQRIQQMAGKGEDLPAPEGQFL